MPRKKPVERVTVQLRAKKQVKVNDTYYDAWTDTEWPTVEAARHHYPKLFYREIIIK